MSTTVAAANKEVNGCPLSQKKVQVVFVLGGPGSGKGTQCAKIVQNFGYTHLSVGDLLRAETESGSENGTMIQNIMNEGKLVPSEITVKLLERAMLDDSNVKFLIDGFPRNEENRVTFEAVTRIEPEFVLFFDCPEKEMERRILSRNQGREDDNIDTIRNRFKVFLESTCPVIEYYESKGKVRKVKKINSPLYFFINTIPACDHILLQIDAGKPVEEVFEEVKKLFSPQCDQ